MPAETLSIKQLQLRLIGMINSRRSLTLIELLISISLLVVIGLTVASISTSFKQFYVDTVQRQNVIAQSGMYVLEDISNNLIAANNITITNGGATAAIRVDNDPNNRNRAPTPTDTTDDTVYTYSKSGDTILYHYKTGSNAATGDVVIANNVTTFNFSLAGTYNKVMVTLGVTPHGSPESKFVTTVTMRGYSI